MDRMINPPVTLEITDSKTGLTGWLAIDSLINNHCHGGLRMLPDVSAFELTELAKVMTLKFGFLGIPHGGAKAGIRYDENVHNEHKLQLMTTFCLKIQDLLADHIYFPGQDMGTTNQDIRYMLHLAGIRVPQRALSSDKSGWYTSLTVIASTKVGAIDQGLDLSKSTVAIEGFGQVGSSVAQGIHQIGGKVVAISTIQGAIYSSAGLNIPKLLEMYHLFGSKMVDHYEGSERIDKEQLLALNVDVLLLCARHHSITMKNVSQIKAKLICSGANIPITEEAEEFLFQRGVLCVPDFISNSGGVLGGTMEFAGLNQGTIGGIINNTFSKQVSSIIKKSRLENVCPRELAKDIAHNRFARMKEISERPSLRNQAFRLALELYRNGMIPKIFVGSLAERYFRKRIEGGIEE